MKPYLLLFLAASVMFTVCSCSNDDYVNAIPKHSTVLLAINPQANDKQLDWEYIIKDWLQIDDLKESGIDLSQRIFVFESPEGHIGLCAPLHDADKLDAALSKRWDVELFRDIRFFSISDSWLAGFTDDVLLVLGPLTLQEQGEARSQMVRYLRQDEDHSVKSSTLFARVDSMQSPMALAASAGSLPEKLAAIMTLGAPKEAQLSDIMIAASITPRNIAGTSCLFVDGQTYSENSEIDNYLRSSKKQLRPISGTFKDWIGDHDALCLMLNVNGETFLHQLTDNKNMMEWMSSVNSIIDFNKIFKTIDGDVLLQMQGIENPKVNFKARLSSRSAFQDVAYWKQSCPKGITMTGDKGSYHVQGKDIRMDFGYTSDNLFYMTNGQPTGSTSAHKPSPLCPMAKGKRLVMVVQPSILLPSSLSKTALGKLCKMPIVYTME